MTVFSVIRRPVIVWACGWGVLFLSLFAGGAWDIPVGSGLPFTILIALIGWSLPGFSLRARLGAPSLRDCAIIWFGSALVGIGLSLVLVPLFNRFQSSAGYLGFVSAVSIAGLVANLLLLGSTLTADRSIIVLVVVAIFSPLVFAAGAYISIVGGYILGELIKELLKEVVDCYPGLLAGWFLGGSIGGTLVGSVTQLFQSNVNAVEGKKTSSRKNNR